MTSGDFDVDLFLVVVPKEPSSEAARAFWNGKEDGSGLMTDDRRKEFWLGRSSPDMPERAHMPGGAGAVYDYLFLLGTGDTADAQYRIPRLDADLAAAIKFKFAERSDEMYSQVASPVLQAFLERHGGWYVFAR